MGTFDTQCDSCPTCTPGKYRGDTCAGDSAGTCHDCPTGKYRSAAMGNGECMVCDNCNPGTYRVGCSGNTAGTCDNCDNGKFKTGTHFWHVECANCQAGQFTTTTGAQKCYYCPAGKYQNLPGKDYCEGCTACGADGFHNSGCRGPNAGQCLADKADASDVTDHVTDFPGLHATLLLSNITIAEFSANHRTQFQADLTAKMGYDVVIDSAVAAVNSACDRVTVSGLQATSPQVDKMGDYYWLNMNTPGAGGRPVFRAHDPDTDGNHNFLYYGGGWAGSAHTYPYWMIGPQLGGTSAGLLANEHYGAPDMSMPWYALTGASAPTDHTHASWAPAADLKIQCKPTAAVAVNLHIGEADDCASTSRKAAMQGWEATLKTLPAELKDALIVDGATGVHAVTIQHSTVRNCVPRIELRVKGQLVHTSNIHY